MTLYAIVYRTHSKLIQRLRARRGSRSFPATMLVPLLASLRFWTRGPPLRKSSFFSAIIHFCLRETSLCDPGGAIPKWLINLVSSKVPQDWLWKMSVECRKIQKDPQEMKVRDAYVKEQIDRDITCPMKP